MQSALFWFFTFFSLRVFGRNIITNHHSALNSIKCARISWLFLIMLSFVLLSSFLVYVNIFIEIFFFLNTYYHPKKSPWVWNWRVPTVINPQNIWTFITSYTTTPTYNFYRLLSVVSVSTLCKWLCISITQWLWDNSESWAILTFCDSSIHTM